MNTTIKSTAFKVHYGTRDVQPHSFIMRKTQIRTTLKSIFSEVNKKSEFNKTLGLGNFRKRILL